MRPEDISDIKFVLRRYLPSSLIIVILSNLSELYHNDLHKILETNYILVLLLIGFAIMIMTNICRMNETVLESKSLGRNAIRIKIRFVLATVPEFALVFTADVISIYILFMSLFYFAYGMKNPYADFLIWFFHYPFSLGIMLAIGYVSRRVKRISFGEISVDKNRLFCTKSRETIIKNWITTSLVLLVLLNLFLISI